MRFRKVSFSYGSCPFVSGVFLTQFLWEWKRKTAILPIKAKAGQLARRYYHGNQSDIYLLTCCISVAKVMVGVASKHSLNIHDGLQKVAIAQITVVMFCLCLKKDFSS